MMARRHLLLDYGQVICTAQPPAEVAELAEVAALPTAEFSRRYWTYRAPYDRGGSALAYWTDILGAAPSATRLRRLVELDLRSWLHFDPTVLGRLDAFHVAGTPLSLLSNAPRELADELAGREEFAAFEHLLFSADLTMVKPDPRIFHAAAERLGAAPEDIVFVDDRLENTAAAAGIGIHAITYTATPDCLREIERAV